MGVFRGSFPSLSYFGVKVGDGFNQLLILDHPNPLSLVVDLGVVGKGPKCRIRSEFDSLCSSPRPKPDSTLRINLPWAHASCAPEETWGRRD